MALLMEKVGEVPDPQHGNAQHRPGLWPRSPADSATINPRSRPPLDPAHPLDQVGLEAGPLSQWLFSGLVEKDVPVVCIETRHTKAFLKAQINKSGRNDARGIAQMMRVNLFRPVHVKTPKSQHRRALLSGRKLLQEKAIAIENDIFHADQHSGDGARAGGKCQGPSPDRGVSGTCAAGLLGSPKLR